MEEKQKRSLDIVSEGQVLSRIYFGRELSGVEECLKGYDRIYIACDSNVKGYAREVAAAAGGRVKGEICIEAFEGGKTIENVSVICGQLLEEGADRGSLLVAIGGGITSDMAAFAACIYKRGIPFGLIPTTLLSQVDAAIGGKTGVNYEGYKNMLGIIRQPLWTYICPKVLESLPRREFLCGVAEMLKTFIIEDRNGGYGRAVKALGQGRMPSKEELMELVRDAAAVKAAIVGRDPFEKGERRKLNLGHTFAHAIEKLSGGVIKHGEAVAMGIIMAARLSSKELADRIEADFLSCGLRTDCPFDPSDMTAIMAKDKKAEGDMIHFIVPEAIGRVKETLLRAEEAAELLKI